MAQYDNTCKILVEQFTADIVTWLMGEPIALTTLESTELVVDPIYTDSLVLLESANLLLHLEFQVTPKPELPFRMLDYRVRGYRRYPQKTMRQVLIYLRSSPSPLVYQDQFELENTSHRFEVIRLWEQPTETFLATPGLLPFAVLSRTEDPVATLQQVSLVLKNLKNLPSPPSIEQNLTAATTILAGLLLDNDRIHSILRRDTMRESSVYQAILAEGREEGREEGLTQGLTQGLAQGRTEEALNLVLRMLRRRLRSVEPDRSISRELLTRLEGLSVFQLEDLGEALLEFKGIDDLLGWLEKP